MSETTVNRVPCSDTQVWALSHRVPKIGHDFDGRAHKNVIFSLFFISNLWKRSKSVFLVGEEDLKALEGC